MPRRARGPLAPAVALLAPLLLAACAEDDREHPTPGDRAYLYACETPRSSLNAREVPAPGPPDEPGPPPTSGRFDLRLDGHRLDVGPGGLSAGRRYALIARSGPYLVLEVRPVAQDRRPDPVQFNQQAELTMSWAHCSGQPPENPRVYRYDPVAGDTVGDALPEVRDTRTDTTITVELPHNGAYIMAQG